MKIIPYYFGQICPSFTDPDCQNEAQIPFDPNEQRIYFKNPFYPNYYKIYDSNLESLIDGTQETMAVWVD